MGINLIIALSLIIYIPFLIGSIFKSNDLKFSLKWFRGILLLGYFLQLIYTLQFSRDISYFTIFVFCLVVISIIFIRKNSKEKINHINKADILFLVILTLFIANSILSILSNPVFSWDAVAIWFNKTRAINAFQPISQLPIVNYPNFGPFLWNFVFNLTDNQEAYGRILFPIFYFLFYLGIYEFYKKKINRYYLIIILTFLMSLFYNEFAINGYQDVLLFSISGYSLLLFLKLYNCIFLYKNYKNPEFLSIFLTYLLCISSMGIIKNEGIVFGLIFYLFSIPLVYSLAKYNKIFLIYSIVPIFSILLFWPIVLKINSINPTKIQGDAFVLDSIFYILDSFYRIPIIFNFLVNIKQESHIFFLITFIISSISIQKKPSELTKYFLFWGIYLFHYFFIFIAFYFTRADLDWHLSTAMDRLIYQQDSLLVVILIQSLSVIIPRIKFNNQQILNLNTKDKSISQ